MKANELRIGNWVKIGETNTCVICIFETSCELLIGSRKRSTSLFEVKPIPLTTEILEKCGFEKYKDVSGYTPLPCWRKNFVGIEWRKKIKAFTVVWYDANDDYGTTMASVKIEYLHQLQNLIHALTGEELEVKL